MNQTTTSTLTTPTGRQATLSTSKQIHPLSVTDTTNAGIISFIIALIVFIILLFVFALILMYLWNWIIPKVFPGVQPLTFWYAFGIIIIIALIKAIGWDFGLSTCWRS